MNQKRAAKLAKLAIPAFALAWSSVQAANIDSNIAEFSFSASSSDTDVGATANLTNSPAVTVYAPALEQFDSYYGVLTGVTLYLESDQTLALTGEATRSGVAKNAFFAGQGTLGSNKAIFKPLGGGSQSAWSSGTLKLGTYSDAMTTSTIKCATDCTVEPADASSAATESATKSITGNANLNQYVGLGTVSTSALGFSWSPGSVGANIYSAAAGVTGSATATLAWSGNLTATYTYIDHAYASFNDALAYNDELTLDFGSVQKGSLVSPLGFDIFNLEGESTGLDFTGISASSGDTSTLTTDLPGSFQDLAAGDFLSFLAFFDTSNAGSFNARYTLNFRDTIGIGASGSRAQWPDLDPEHTRKRRGTGPGATGGLVVR